MKIELRKIERLFKIKTYIYTQLWTDPFDRNKTHRGINRDERIYKEND